jgi:hypothetical protein
MTFPPEIIAYNTERGHFIRALDGKEGQIMWTKGRACFELDNFPVERVEEYILVLWDDRKISTTQVSG